MLTSKGFTLIELLIVSAIMALTLLVGLPALQDFQHSQRARQDIAALKILLHSSREQAIHLAERLTLCPDSGNQQCGNDWNQPLILLPIPIIIANWIPTSSCCTEPRPLTARAC